MIERTQSRIEPQALEELPHDWSRQLADGLKAEYLVGYDADLDEAHVWFSTERQHAVQVPLTSLIDITIDDETTDVIGFVAYQFAQTVRALFPDATATVICDAEREHPRLSSDIRMTPIQHLSAPLSSERFARALAYATHFLAA